MSDTVFNTALVASRRQAVTARRTAPIFGRLLAAIRTMDAHDAIEQATVWASLAGGGFFVVAMVLSAFT